MGKKKVYLEKINAQLEQYSAKISVLKAKGNEAHADVKLEYLKQVEKLEDNRDGLRVKYEQLKEASSNSWDDLQEGSEAAWDELKESLSKVVENFK